MTELLLVIEEISAGWPRCSAWTLVRCCRMSGVVSQHTNGNRLNI